MSALCFEFEWEDPGAIKGPELRATWGTLKITVDGVPTTSLIDHRSRSVRDSLRCPLYPLAEWITVNWFFLLHETGYPLREADPSFLRRHDIRFGGDGYALPSLCLLPDGKRVLLQWRETQLPDHRLGFLNSGESVIELDSLQDTLRDFVENVIDRIKDQELGFSTLLEEEWLAINQLSGEEREFCQISAAAGLHPFSMNDAERKKLEETFDALPSTLVYEFFNGSKLDNYDDNLRWIKSALEQTCPERGAPGNGVVLRDVRNELHSSTGEPLPWEEGYAKARELRAVLRLGDTAFYREVFDQLDLENVHREHPKGPDAFEGLVGLFEDDSPAFFVERQREESYIFLMARALYDYLWPLANGPSLITRTHSYRQKCNRAFAAELVAPKESIRAKLGSQKIADRDEVSELADSFGVSWYIVDHQIRNHKLARIISPEMF